MAVVLAAAGFLLYDHLAASLDRTLAQSLRARAGDVSALVQQSDTGLRESRLDAGNTGFAQVLDARGRIFDQTPTLGQRVLLTPGQWRRARHATLPMIGKFLSPSPNIARKLFCTRIFLCAIF